MSVTASEQAKSKRAVKRRLPPKIKKGIRDVDEFCRNGSPEMLAEQYVDFCLGAERPRLPNISGFFRWLTLPAAARDHFIYNYPESYKTVRMIFEDEALNSPLPPSIVSAYMKQYFSADGEKDSGADTADRSDGITLIFEHDIFHDGE